MYEDDEDGDKASDGDDYDDEMMKDLAEDEDIDDDDDGDDEDDDDEEEEEEEEEDTGGIEIEGTQTPSGLETPSGIQSVAEGLETPAHIELRKHTKPTVPRPTGPPPQLYQVIPEREGGGQAQGFMGSERLYDFSSQSRDST